MTMVPAFPQSAGGPIRRPTRPFKVAPGPPTATAHPSTAGAVSGAHGGHESRDEEDTIDQPSSLRELVATSTASPLGRPSTPLHVAPAPPSTIGSQYTIFGVATGDDFPHFNTRQGGGLADPFGHATPGPEYGFLFAAESVGVEELHTPNNRDESSSDNHAPTTLTSQLTEKKIHFGFNSHLSTHLTKNQGPVGAPIDPVGYQAEPPAFGSEQSSSATNPENDDPTWTNEQTGLTGRVMTCVTQTTHEFARDNEVTHLRHNEVDQHNRPAVWQHNPVVHPNEAIPWQPNQAVEANNPPNQNAAIDQFVPTTMVLFGRGYQRLPTQQERLLQIFTGMSPNYRGDPGNLRNYSAILLPDEDSCSFWITGLPPDVTVTEILAAIRRTGRIMALHINREDERKHTSGAKLIFFDKRGAMNFYRRYVGVRGALTIRGYVAYIVRNWYKTPESTLPRYHSRCLRICGPRRLVNEEHLLGWLRRNIEFEVDEVVHHQTREPGTGLLTIRFGAYRGQASLAYKALRLSGTFNSHPNFFVRWDRDPCA